MHEGLDVLVNALARNMRGVHATVLASRDWTGRSFLRPYEARALVAGAFTRYPYPESFFGWSGSGSLPTLFVRANHRPPWLSSPIPGERYPVEIVDEPAVARAIRAALASDIRAGQRDAVVALEIAGDRYQLVARVEYAADASGDVAAAFGFLVNLREARKRYFAEILGEVARLSDAARGLDYALIDDHGEFVVGSPTHDAQTVHLERPLTILFIDPRQGSPASLARAGARQVWSVRASAMRDETLLAASQGARRTRLVIGSATLAAVLGLFLAVRVARARVELANVRSDFVSSVTHELKTPLATIRGVAEALLKGRGTAPQTLHRYAHLLNQESRRLIRLVDNLLAYARVTDVTEVYSFQPMEPAELVTAALRGFPNLPRSSVTVDVAPSLPNVQVDRTAMVLALDNVIDNAIRYSPSPPQIRIGARCLGGFVELAVEDRGAGIPAAELPGITRRFVRGRSTTETGSGLGLAIVTRVINDHKGRLMIDSAPGRGTTVRLALPQAEA